MGCKTEKARLAINNSLGGLVCLFVSRSCSPDWLPEERQNAPGEGPLESVGKIDENLTTDRVRAIRSFKFSLVEYLRDLLKPHWKEGRLSKVAHKIIIKKSVNKVIESFGDSKIPSRRKIDCYLNSSHSKLSKLVQAYVEKYQKG